MICVWRKKKKTEWMQEHGSYSCSRLNVFLFVTKCLRPMRMVISHINIHPLGHHKIWCKKKQTKKTFFLNWIYSYRLIKHLCCVKWLIARLFGHRWISTYSGIYSLFWCRCLSYSKVLFKWYLILSIVCIFRHG